MIHLWHFSYNQLATVLYYKWHGRCIVPISLVLNTRNPELGKVAIWLACPWAGLTES